MNAQKKTVAGVATALIVATIGGGIASHSLIGSSAAPLSAESLVAAQKNLASPIPFLGPYAEKHAGYAQCGPGVRLMEGALRLTSPPVRKTKASNCVGKATTRQIIAFQKRHHIPPSGIYGLRTHLALAHAYSDAQVASLVFLATQRRQALQRSTILVVTSHAKVFERRMIYCDAGSLARCSHRGDFPAWPDVPRHTDCSGYVTWVLETATGINPNSIGVGSTRTLVYHGVPVPPNGPLKVGDLVFYGSNTHVAIYIGHGLVSSHGRNYIDIHPYGYRPIYAIRRYL